MPTITPNSHVNFKRGQQTTINTLLNGSGSRFDEGTFYLTTDTNRLYFAQTSELLVNLNQYIHFYSSNGQDVLPNAQNTGMLISNGDIYYWEDKNALIICKDANNGTWTQLNPDTYLDEDNSGGLTVTDGTTAGSKKISLSVMDTGHREIASDVTLVPGDSNLTITSSGNVITLTSANDNDNTTYAIGTTASAANSRNGTITLTPTNIDGTTGTVQNINLLGSGNVSVTTDNAGNVTIHSAGGVSDIDATFDSNGNYTTLLDLTVGGDITVSTLQQIKYGENGTATSTFNADPNDTTNHTGVATLDVYTTDEVDTKIEAALGAADALKYQGTVSNSDFDSKITYDANAGEVYKAASAINRSYSDGASGTNTIIAKTGDLLISEGEDGNVTWVVVPSGDDQFIELDVPTNDNSFNFYDQNSNTDMGGFSIGGSSLIDVSSAVSGNLDTFKTYTISHLAPTNGTAVTISPVVAALDSNSNPVANATELRKANRYATSIDIPVITSLSYDSYGHVTAATGKTYKIWDSHGSLDSVDFTSAVQTSTVAGKAYNTATIGITAVFDDVAATMTNPLTITSEQDNIKISADGTSGVKLELVWGTF